jgi:hypothetical protein
MTMENLQTFFNIYCSLVTLLNITLIFWSSGGDAMAKGAKPLYLLIASLIDLQY